MKNTLKFRRFLQAIKLNEIDLIKAMIYYNNDIIDLEFSKNYISLHDYNIIKNMIKNISKYGNIKLFNLFLEKNYKEKNILNITNTEETNILMEACKYGNFNIIETIIKYISKKHLYENINKQDIIGNTTLLYAVFSGNVKICELLLENNAQIEITDNCERSVLHYAAEYGYNNIINLFLKKYYNDFRNGCISHDTYNNYINNQDTYGYTPLMISSYNDFSDIASTLLFYKANINIESNCDGAKAIDIATRESKNNLITILSEYKNIRNITNGIDEYNAIYQ